jgi:hypothetical protein
MQAVAPAKGIFCCYKCGNASSQQNPNQYAMKIGAKEPAKSPDEIDIARILMQERAKIDARFGEYEKSSKSFGMFSKLPGMRIASNLVGWLFKM